jgi:hypothetical protein
MPRTAFAGAALFARKGSVDLAPVIVAAIGA